jgi:hydrogenase/urease accessory protein HupE
MTGGWLARCWRRGLQMILLGLALLPGLPALAHEMSMAEMLVQEVAPGRFVWQWTAGMRSGGNDLVPLWPEGCGSEGNQVQCGPAGMVGALGMQGVGQAFSAVLVKLHWLDGGLRVYTPTKGQPTVQLYGAADDKRGGGEIARAYALLGVEHILGGIDHLLFVVSLLFLVGFQRRLVWTISAFTLAHSLTLGLSALGWISLRSPPVEATIALSIVLVAAEALHQRQTLSRRWPALVALLFGLVHGLGFAGALQQIGLPQQHLVLALLSFNLGVELGQLLVLAVLWLGWRALRGQALLARGRTPALYAIGGMAAYWTIGRVAAIVL